MLHHPGMADQNDRQDTAIFIKKVITWWQIINVRGMGADVRHRNELEEVFTYPEDLKPFLNLLKWYLKWQVQSKIA